MVLYKYIKCDTKLLTIFSFLATYPSKRSDNTIKKIITKTLTANSLVGFKECSCKIKINGIAKNILAILKKLAILKILVFAGLCTT